MARIVILEDESDIAELYRMALEDRGHEILAIHADLDDVFCPGGDPARGAELIILDDRLGGVSAVLALGRFRKRFPSARIIVVSADQDALDLGLGGGAEAAEKKPLTLRRLADAVDSLMARPTA
ncbi:MAG TPA: hypothetical protein VE981_01385 [Planctomycetota bacterium]|nr:hypothetical protein [Planctomycetota bacterium]